MLQIINTKLLVAILAALTVLGGFLYREHQVHEQEAATAARTAALLQQQRADQEAAQKQDKQTWDDVREKRKKQNNMPARGSKPWTHYLP